MFREMRFAKRQLSLEEAMEILKNETYGVLSVSGDDNYPYGVPLNYGYIDGKIYIHSTSAESHKLSGIRSNSKVCFTVVSKHELLKEAMSTDFASVIVFGEARILTEETEKTNALEKMMLSLAPEYVNTARTHCGGHECYVMLEITPVHITGKMRR